MYCRTRPPDICTCRPTRPLPLMMPAVTVWSSPSGLPTASTHSPTSSASELPSRAAIRSLGGLSRRITATSVSESMPMVRAENSRPSLNTTVVMVAPETTWRLVTMLPLLSSTTPDPVPRSGWSGASSPPPPKSKNLRKNGGTSWPPPPPPVRPRAGICWISTSMRTTLGRRAFATAEKADDKTRASLGASVRGVTGPAPGWGTGAGAAVPGAGEGGAVP